MVVNDKDQKSFQALDEMLRRDRGGITDDWIDKRNDLADTFTLASD
jgi:hypothetical protein